MASPSTGYSKQSIIISTTVTLLVIALLGIGVQTLNPPASQANIMHAAHYTDGHYMANGNYSSPGGIQNVSVDVTLQNNKVTKATVVGKADSGVAQIYQSYFVKGFRPYVIGKNINDIHVSRVSGSSLTSQGFTQALNAIKKQASAQQN